MGDMFRVMLEYGGTFSAEAAIERCLARGLSSLDFGEPLEKLQKEREWTELCLSAEACDPEASGATSEELFLRWVADACVQTGLDRGETPVDRDCSGKLWDKSFSVQKGNRLHIVELDYTPPPKAGDAMGEKVEAVVLVPSRLAIRDLARVDAFSSSARGGPEPLDHAARATALAKRDAEIRLAPAAYHRAKLASPSEFIDGMWSPQSRRTLRGTPTLSAHAAGFQYLHVREGKDVSTLVCLDVGEPSAITLDKGAPEITCMLGDGDTAWVGTTSGLYEVRDGDVGQKLTTKQGLSGPAIHALCRTADGAIIVGTSGGLSILREGKVTESVKKGLTSKGVHAIAEGTDGLLWLAGEAGVTRRDADGSLTKLGAKQGLSSPGGLVALPSGHLLVGSTDATQGTRMLAPNASIATPFAALAGLESVVSGSRVGGVLWLLLRDGALLRLQGGQPARLFVLANLSVGHVPWACGSYVDDGVFWIAGGHGVVGVRVADLTALLAKPAHSTDIVGDEHITELPVPIHAGR